MPKGYKPKGMDRVVLAIYEAFKRKRKKPLSFVRSKAISKGLSDAGISQKKISQMRSPKKDSPFVKAMKQRKKPNFVESISVEGRMKKAGFDQATIDRLEGRKKSK